MFKVGDVVFCEQNDNSIGVIEGVAPSRTSAASQWCYSVRFGNSYYPYVWEDEIRLATEMEKALYE